jgi:hypothetical protein
MTLKQIAIVILALLGLSSVMNAKAFRIFLGGLSALCVLVFLGILTLSDRSNVIAKSGPGVAKRLSTKLQRFFDAQPDFRESAENTSQQFLDDLRAGRDINEIKAKPDNDMEVDAPAATVKPKMIPRVVGWQKYPVTIKKDTEANERASFTENIYTVMGDYLKRYKKQSNEIGVDRLVPENLNPRLLKLFGERDQDGQVKLTVVFNDTFHQHVRLSGRRVVKKERLRSAASAAVALGTLLFLSYGTLKVLNSRRRRRDADYLQTSNISMV